MQPNTIKSTMALADGLATLLRTTALTVGPPLLRLAGDEKDGRRFTGIVREADRTGAASANADKPKVTPLHGFGTPIAYLCSQCGGADVRIEAYAQWDEAEQKWACQSTYIRAAECARCGPTHLMPKPLDKPRPI